MSYRASNLGIYQEQEEWVEYPGRRKKNTENSSMSHFLEKTVSNKFVNEVQGQIICGCLHD